MIKIGVKKIWPIVLATAKQWGNWLDHVHMLSKEEVNKLSCYVLSMNVRIRAGEPSGKSHRVMIRFGACQWVWVSAVWEWALPLNQSVPYKSSCLFLTKNSQWTLGQRSVLIFEETNEFLNFSSHPFIPFKMELTTRLSCNFFNLHSSIIISQKTQLGHGIWNSAGRCWDVMHVPQDGTNQSVRFQYGKTGYIPTSWLQFQQTMFSDIGWPAEPSAPKYCHYFLSYLQKTSILYCTLCKTSFTSIYQVMLCLPFIHRKSWNTDGLDAN